MRRLIPFLILALLALPMSAMAQAATVGSLAWSTAPSTLAAVQGAQQTVKVDGVSVTVTPVCTGPDGNVICRAILPASALTAGNHTYQVIILSGGVEYAGYAVTIDPSKGILASNVSITITQTLTP